MVLIAALVLALAGIAVAASGGDTIHACVNNVTRVLSVPKSGRACPRGSSALSWNARGLPGAQGAPGAPGAAGAPATSASASASVNPSAPIDLGSSDTTLMTATITTSASTRIEASGGGTFAYTPSGTGAAELDCGLQILRIAVGGGSGPFGNRTQEDFSGSVAYKEPGSAGGAILAPAGSYGVSLVCHQLVSNASLAFVHGDLNVVAATP